MDVSGKNYGRRPEKQEIDSMNPRTQKKITELPRSWVRLEKLPFTAMRNEVIYVEGEVNRALNNIIRSNYWKIKRCFEDLNLKFVYMPLLDCEVLADRSFMEYYFPEGNAPEFGNFVNLSSKTLLNFLSFPGMWSDVCYPALFRSKTNGKSDSVPYDRWEIDAADIVDVEYYFTQAAKYIKKCEEAEFLDEIQFSIGPEIGDGSRGKKPVPHAEEFADRNFDEGTLDIMRDIKTGIDLLRQRGVSEMILKQLVAPQIEMSRLTIDRRNRIVLSDYDNREVVMTPLVKAVYFLFLAHPEGIRFKELMDYREELTQIYYCIREGREVEPLLGQRVIPQSIIDLTDPTKNSINEKCALIKKAFLSVIPDYLAHNYYVIGLRGKPKRVILSRDLITGENLQFLQGLQS